MNQLALRLLKGEKDNVCQFVLAIKKMKKNCVDLALQYIMGLFGGDISKSIVCSVISILIPKLSHNALISAKLWSKMPSPGIEAINNSKTECLSTCT